jgi:hypothetical protein
MTIVYRGGRPYAYRSVRRNGRVTSEYRGSGEFALFVEWMDALDREDSELERVERGADHERLDAAERALTDYSEHVEALTRAALFAAGFHLHKRQWRKRRGR